MKEKIINILLKHYPHLEAIYLYGSFAQGIQGSNSDVDIAVLLPHKEAKKVGSLGFSDARVGLSKELHRDVDLINLRLVNTVMQKEVIKEDSPIYVENHYSVDQFEMLTLS
ncbi:MAG: nucleotidyltransferase domain-containing protein [Spirochaetaceae bacterium]|jgi:predicted nucleotidyltransferase|nr:nucleotidyltransferase domain-containing protein [Spirochaetaceae bacterium]